jgi:hypothetical protein
LKTALVIVPKTWWLPMNSRLVSYPATSFMVSAPKRAGVWPSMTVTSARAGRGGCGPAWLRWRWPRVLRWCAPRRWWGPLRRSPAARRGSARTGNLSIAEAAVKWLYERATASGTALGRGCSATTKALVTTRKRAERPAVELTTQERYIARLAGEGDTNSEIGGHLLSALAQWSGTLARSSPNSV